MKRIYQVLLTIVFIGIAGIFVYSKAKETPVKDKIELVGLPTQIDFAGEAAPLNIVDVRERLDREMLINTNLHSSTTLVLKRANRAFPVIEPILKKYGVPDDFKYLAVIESGLVNAVSPAGARGVWQFMPETAKEKGMEVNEYVDERYHLEKSTEAACRYLLEAKNKFGSWTLAAASYNGGMTGINRQLESQQVSDYYDVLLTEETSRYVFRILALKEIMQNPVKYGFDIPKDQLYYPIESRKIEIDTPISNLSSFAKENGINYKILKLHNPWLRDKKLENKSKKVYILAIPTEGY
ncbi:lytic transglycosylase domain-containing protein [Flavobacterium sp.]|uniref:lytic transglycosylase domain-containing protein n=1 Tax=Flavobacterium sp. TaxID=239 RepID=UPI00263309D9|nr:lytic transglycosylase domain-containing protein [Flavobacterium sp.]MDD2986642.1 lytic transglycosylase domain-containing protein [Flavobacterium sp.]